MNAIILMSKMNSNAWKSDMECMNKCKCIGTCLEL